MRGAPQSMKVLRPRSADEAVDFYGRTPEAAPLAGGTDFMVAWNAGLQNGRTILDISAIEPWKSVRALKDKIQIGSLVTYTQLQSRTDIRREFPLLARACRVIGALAIQNRGTLGGNVANASPAGDSFPPLSVYEASIHAVSSQGRRVIPVSGIFAGVKKTTLRPGELIESIEIPILAKRPHRQYFRKVGTRAAQALSKTVAAGLLWLAPSGEVSEMRFALGSMAPTVRRLKSAEDFVRGKRLTPETISRACELLEKDVSPIDDLRSTAQYRMGVSKNLLKEFLEDKQ